MRFPLGSKNLEVSGQGGGQPQSAPAQATMPMGVNSMGQMVVPTITDSSGSSRKIQTPEWQGAAEQQRQGFQREAGAAEIEAQNQVKLAEQQAPAYQAEKLRAAAEREQHIVRMAKIQQDIDARTKLHDQRVAATMQTPGGFWDDKTEGQKSMVRIGIWLSALGGGLAGQDNRAVSYLNTMIERDAKEKQARAERLYKQADIAKGYLADAYKARADELSDYNANVEAGWRAVAHDAEAYAKTMLPQQLRAQADQKIAQINQKAAEANMKAQQELAVDVHSQHSVVQPTNMNAGGAGGKTTPGMNDITEYTVAQELDRKATRLDQLTRQGQVPTPEQMDHYQNAVNAIVGRQIKEAHDPTQVTIGSIGRAIGLLPSNAYGDMTPGQREWLRLHTEMVHQVAVKKFGQSAMSNPESYHEYVDPLIYGRGKTKKEGITLGKAMSDQMHEQWRNARVLSKAGHQDDVAEVKAANQAKPAAGGNMPQPGAALPPSVEKDYKEALMVPKGHADYKEAQEYIANVRRKYPGVK